MISPRPLPGSTVLSAMLCAGAVTAQLVAGKATRDALFLAHLPVTALSTMFIATSVVSLVLVSASSKWVSQHSLATFVPAWFAASAVGLIAEWLLTSWAPRTAAVLVYLHISGLAPMVGSGFWLIASERFDPRTAKQRFGQITGAGTIGGLVGLVLTDRVATFLDVAAMLPMLAAINLVCAWQVRALARPLEAEGRAMSIEIPPDLTPAPARSGLRVLAGAPYLRNLATVVLLGTISAALVDYVFKMEASTTFDQGNSLLQFFARYYLVTNLIAVLVQASSTRFVLEKFGVALATSTPSFAVLVGGLGRFLAPGLESAMVLRGGESVCRGSLFRAGYELFYTPIPPGEKRAAKSLIDVGVDRLGDALGGAIIAVTLMLGPGSSTVLIVLSMACSAGAVVFARRLNRGYIQALEKSLLDRAVELDLSDVVDRTTRTTILRTLARRSSLVRGSLKADRMENLAALSAASASVDPEIRAIESLRSRDRERILGVLRNEEGVTRALVPHVIPLLAWDPVADAAVFALRKVAEERVGELTDALIDPNHDFAIRRRLARVFSVCASQRAVDGLLFGLEDLRFEVRFQCGRSLAAIFDKNPRVRIDKDRIFEVVLREVAVGRPVWESRRLLDQLDDREPGSFVGELVRNRASQSLAHVFTLLSLVLSREPLQIAYRGLHTDDRHLRGTALEYLEGVLPAAIRERLWPFLEELARRG